MRGLQIKPNWKPAIPAERRSFTAFFHPLFPQLAAFHWIYPNTIPFAGVDENFESFIETAGAEGHIPPDTLLPKFARFVREDWVNLYGFLVSPDVPATRRRLHESSADYEWLSQITDICFFNVDGAWWEIYARDATLLEAVCGHVMALPDITVQTQVLTQRDILT